MEATFQIDTPGTEVLFVRIADGACEELPTGSSVDWVIFADPVTSLLVTSGAAQPVAGHPPRTDDIHECSSRDVPKFFDLFVFP